MGLCDLDNKAVFLEKGKKRKMQHSGSIPSTGSPAGAVRVFTGPVPTRKLVAENAGGRGSGSNPVPGGEKKKNFLEKYAEAMILRRMTRESGPFSSLNDHVDLALMVEADGVHIGQDDLPPSGGPRVAWSREDHRGFHPLPGTGTAAGGGGADYIGSGRFFLPPQRRDVCPPGRPWLP